MKTRKLLLTVVTAVVATTTHAGGLMTNTNYHIAFDRMMARGATFGIDAAYSNPAGLAWGDEGFQLSLNFQKPWQNRDIETTIPGFLGTDFHQKYAGKASAPIVPALFAAYRKERVAVSAMIGIVGSGGFVKYDDGVPMFSVPLMAMLATQGLMPGSYTLDSQMKGKQYIYGGQLNLTYRLSNHLAAAVGLRANYYDGYNRGHVSATLAGANLIGLRMDCVQRDWGFCPIVSLDYHQGPLTVAARYEFRTKINVTNDTKELSLSTKDIDLDVKALAEKAGNDAIVSALTMELGPTAERIGNYLPDKQVRYDMPSLLVLAVGYEFCPRLRATLEYHFFDDKNAKMADNRQKELTHGTHELQVGAEYDLSKRVTLSCGAQRTDYGLSDAYQQNTSFACDSYSIGLGGAVSLTDRIKLNAGYFITLYSDYTKAQDQYVGSYAGKDVYSRTNNVVGIGLDYKF